MQPRSLFFFMYQVFILNVLGRQSKFLFLCLVEQNTFFLLIGSVFIIQFYINMVAFFRQQETSKSEPAKKVKGSVTEFLPKDEGIKNRKTKNRKKAMKS